MNIQIQYHSPHSGDLTLRNISGEIEINGGYPNIKLEELRPASPYTIGGQWKPVSPRSPEKPISISARAAT
jgi:hypothetical protein